MARLKGAQGEDHGGWRRSKKKLSAVSILTSSLVLAVCGVDAAALASAGAAEATDEDSTALGSAGAAVAVDAAVMASISVDTNADTSHTLGSVGTTEAEDDDVAAVSAAEAAPPLALTGPPLRGASLTGGGGGLGQPAATALTYFPDAFFLPASAPAVCLRRPPPCLARCLPRRQSRSPCSF